MKVIRNMKLNEKQINNSLQVSNTSYYRCLPTFGGEKIIFEPKGYYEVVNDDGTAIMRYGEYVRSKVKELSASKYIGGSIMGSYSMNRNTRTYYIYKINEKPDVDISHWTSGDFEFLQEVRYRRPVEGSYIGYIYLSDYLFKAFDTFHEYISPDDVYGKEYTEEQNRLIEDIFYNGKFMQVLKNLKTA